MSSDGEEAFIDGLHEQGMEKVMTIKVALNGYGTIGKRVADAVDAQDDMEIIGVTKTRPSFAAPSLFARATLSTVPTTMPIKSLLLNRLATHVSEA